MHKIKLTSRFEEALMYAERLHARQYRKGSDIPYIAHLLAVTGLVLEDGGDEDQAIAALLHDAVEDQGGLPTLEVIRSRFGERVAAIVEGCSDAFTNPKPAWLDRKKIYIEHLKHASPEVRRVSLADKLHNSHAILRTLILEGERTWERFKGGKAGTLWYYREILAVFQDTGSDFMTAELADNVQRIEKIAMDEQI